MKKHRWILWTVLLLLPTCGIALEENVVIELPAVPRVSTTLSENIPDYTPDTLAAYYDQGENGMAASEQFPALTQEEQQRAKTLQLAYDEGKLQPAETVLNKETTVVVGVYALKPNDYSGEVVYVLLPARTITDDELLSIIDAYQTLGIPFDPASLTYRNCMRGGGIDSSRFFTKEEQTRRVLLLDLYTRQGLRPETNPTPLPGDDGIGRIQLDEKAFCGLEFFRFIPYRAQSDEELLHSITLPHAETAEVSPSQYVEYETSTRKELRRLFHAPLALERQSETIAMGSRSNIELDNSLIYSVVFKVLSTDSPYTYFYTGLHIEKGSISNVWTELKDADLLYSDLHLDPFEEKWITIACEYITAIRTDGIQIQSSFSMGEASLQYGYGFGALIGVIMEDGGYYELRIAYQNEQVMDVYYLNHAPSVNILTYDW